MIDSCRRGEPLKDVFILDCHGHLGGDGQDFTIRNHSVDRLIVSMDRLGVNQICVSSLLAICGRPGEGNAETARTVRDHPDRFRGYVVVNPRHPGDITAEIEKYRGLKQMGMVKIHPTIHDYPATGPLYRPLWDYCNQHSLIVLSHTFYGDSRCSPGRFEAIAKEYPRVIILLGHSGATHEGFEESLETASKAPNLYLDITSSFSPFQSIERAVRRVGADRVLFGSDMPFFGQPANLGRVAYARIPDRDKEKILGGNMARLIKEHGG